MKRLRKTIVVKRCLVVRRWKGGSAQCDLPRNHGGDYHGAGDVNRGRIQWAIERRQIAKPITDDCEECGGTGTVEVKCEDCGTPLTDRNWKPEYETYACTACVMEEQAIYEQEARRGQSAH